MGKVAQAKKVRGLTNARLAEMTGFKKSTIDAFMCGSRDSDVVADALAKALDIER